MKDVDLEEEQGPDETDDLQEGEGPDEADEAEVTQKRNELNEIDSELAERINEAINQCKVQHDNDLNRPLFMLAHAVRSIEEELNVRFPVATADEIICQWKNENYHYLDDTHDYLAEFLDKLSLVRFPKGRALLRAVEIAKGMEPLKKTIRLCSDFQLLASLCGVLQHQAGEKAFFLDGRSAAKALGRPHETVASWLRALIRLEIIKKVSPGHPGIAARYEYIAKA